MVKVEEILKLNEQTIETFERINALIKDKILDKHQFLNTIIDVLDALNIEDDIIDKLTAKDIRAIVDYLNSYEYKITSAPLNHYYIDDIKYECEPLDTFVLKGRLIGKLYEKINDDDFTSYVLAVIFVDKEKNSKENLDTKLIEKKQKYTKKLLINDYLPYVMAVTSQIIEANTEIL